MGLALMGLMVCDLAAGIRDRHSNRTYPLLCMLAMTFSRHFVIGIDVMYTKYAREPKNVTDV
jgi:hypothetical protein